MNLPSYGQSIARMNPIELDDLDGVVIAAPAGGDILVYDGAVWRNRTVTGDITISATGVVAVVPGTPRQVYQTNAAGTAAEWTSAIDGITIGGTTPAPGTFNTLTKTGTTGISWSNVSDEDYEIFTLPGVTGGPRWTWDESEDAWSTNFGIEITNGVIDLNAQGSLRQIGNAASQLLANAWSLVGAPTQALLVQTTANDAEARLQLTTGANGIDSGPRIRWFEGVGDGSAGNMGYEMGYRPGSSFWRFRSADIDGGPTAGNIMEVADSTDDVLFAGGISTDGLAAPTVGILTKGPFVVSTEIAADPTLAAQTFALFQSTGGGTGDEGDIIIGADNAAGGADKFAVLFDYSAGTVSSARYKERITPLANPYRILDIHASEWDVRGGRLHEWGFIAEDVYKVLGRAGTPMSPVTKEWWNPEYFATYGYKVGDRAPNQVHLAPIVGAHHEILRDLTSKIQDLERQVVALGGKV